jgi:hypothetical protein
MFWIYKKTIGQKNQKLYFTLILVSIKKFVGSNFKLTDTILLSCTLQFIAISYNNEKLKYELIYKNSWMK